MLYQIVLVLFTSLTAGRGGHGVSAFLSSAISSPRIKRSDNAVVIAAPGRLIDEQACAPLRTLCANTVLEVDDFYTLECVQTLHGEQRDLLSHECQTIIWNHLQLLVEDFRVQKLLDKNCAKDKHKIKCKPTEESGQLLACVLNVKDDLTEADCRNFVNRLELVAFSDFRTISSFSKSCRNDVDAFNCGRLSDENRLWSQGATIACLQDHVQGLSEDCKKSIYHLTELQSENFKLDWQLYKACFQDANSFCADIKPGTGDIYKCLTKNKNDVRMSSRCQKELTRRDRVIGQDFKVARGLARACKEDIRVNHCRRGVSEDKNVRLAQILLCLESAYRNNTKIAPDCLKEMQDHRKLIMTDYNLTPELLNGCAEDIDNLCKNLDSGSKTIHCLMDHVTGKKKQDVRVQPKCQRALEFLVKVADVGEDWRVDPILRKACKPVVDVACHDTIGGDARVMSCLMEKLGTNYMTEDCETALLQIQYFVARDYKLDPQLYRACRDDAVKFCNAKKTWADVDGQQAMDPERGPLVLPCLHRYAYPENSTMQLKQKCLVEVKRVMRQRAISVDLIPEVEDVCLYDLSLFCFDKTGRGEEMQCLQDALDKLTKKCKEAVTKYTEDEAGHVELNPIISTYCKAAMARHCEQLLSVGKDDGDMMECLIAHKNDPEMRADVKCRAAVEHFQLTSLKNYHFTYKFKEACRPYVNRYCTKSMTKYDVVACLSEVMRNDTLNGNRHTIPKECRQQVRNQLFQQRENIDFDPKMKMYCQNDTEAFCRNVPHDAGQVLECLRQNHHQLSLKCRHVLFGIKNSELSDSSTDYTLINVCKDMLKQYCRDTDPSKALVCLKVS